MISILGDWPKAWEFTLNPKQTKRPNTKYVMVGVKKVLHYFYECDDVIGQNHMVGVDNFEIYFQFLLHFLWINFMEFAKFWGFFLLVHCDLFPFSYCSCDYISQLFWVVFCIYSTNKDINLFLKLQWIYTFC